MAGSSVLRRLSILATWCVLLCAVLTAPLSHALADPPLPNFSGLPTYNVTVPMSGVTTASTGASDNSAAINSFINYANTHGGGTIEIPAGTYKSSTITMKSNVNLQIDNGGT